LGIRVEKRNNLVGEQDQSIQAVARRKCFSGLKVGGL
jgi:hypothetical protein